MPKAGVGASGSARRLSRKKSRRSGQSAGGSPRRGPTEGVPVERPDSRRRTQALLAALEDLDASLDEGEGTESKLLRVADGQAEQVRAFRQQLREFSRQRGDAAGSYWDQWLVSKPPDTPRTKVRAPSRCHRRRRRALRFRQPATGSPDRAGTADAIRRRGRWPGEACWKRRGICWSKSSSARRRSSGGARRSSWRS